MSNATTVAKFREKLSSWLDSASKEPVYINRGSERFALMGEDTFRELQQKVTDLQASLISLLEDKNELENSDFSEIFSQLEKYKREEA